MCGIVGMSLPGKESEILGIDISIGGRSGKGKARSWFCMNLWVRILVTRKV